MLRAGHCDLVLVDACQAWKLVKEEMKELQKVCLWLPHQLEDFNDRAEMSSDLKIEDPSPAKSKIKLGM